MTTNKQTDWSLESFIELIDSDSRVASHPKKEVLKEFAKIYFSRESVDNMVLHSNEEWLAIFLSHFEFFTQPYQGRFALRVVNIPEMSTCGTFVQVVAKDMPFLVDSLSMAVSRHRYGAQYILTSAGFKASRTEAGELQSVIPYSVEQERDEQSEAIVMIEISYQQSEKCREEITACLNETLYDVDLAVTDWLPMKEKLCEVKDRLGAIQFPAELQPEVDEAIEFLKWNYEDHFIHFGYREYDVVGEGEEKALKLNAKESLGVFRGKKNSPTLKQYQDMPDRVRDRALESKQVVRFIRTAKLAKIHRDDNTSFIVVKKFDDQGQVVGEYRFLGLSTSAAYTHPVMDIPILRKKAKDILKKAGLPPTGHLWKEMVYTMNNLPRDDFMHADVDFLTDWCVSISQIMDRHRTRLFAYLNGHKRNISFLLYLPRENMSESLIQKVEAHFQEKLNATRIRYDARLFGAATARIHYQVDVNPDEIDQLFDLQALEAEIIRMTQSWPDQMQVELLKAYDNEEANRLFSIYRDAFSNSYQDHFSVEDCIEDIAAAERVLGGSNLAIRTCLNKNQGEKSRIKLFTLNRPLPLAEVLPIFENMGVQVHSEFPYKIKCSTGEVICLSDYEVVLDADLEGEIIDTQRFKVAFYKCWSSQTFNDLTNKLVTKIGLSWNEVRILRAYSAYFVQIKFEISPAYVASILVKCHSLAKLFVELFYVRFDPAFSGDRVAAQKEIEDKVYSEMESIQSMDEDRVCRQYLQSILATLRTNFFMSNSDQYIALKIHSASVPGMVEPAPAVEGFVYCSSFEGVHLRTSYVARGGLRWSSRQEDYRTEVLGLECAQQVKNAVIVPSGAKGGFILKRDLTGCSWTDVQNEARRCYTLFMHGLLDLVDNIIDGQVVHNEQVVRHDDVDTYLVVAADKGTATFSDLANSVAGERNFWLGDAFASGGSNGYDHKKMGITAKGAWVSVVRHFKELSVDMAADPISVVGIGDMAGDVFGNGMLLSDNLQLKGAFNHLHIFIDPNPDPKASFEERKRLFAMPGSTWKDYNPELISRGGGVFERAVKSIPVSDEMKEFLGIDCDRVDPNQLIRHVLRAEVDLLWNGGIGTYVKAESEQNVVVGDPANDRLRVNGGELRCRVIGEGGNLGLTQLGRVEYEQVTKGLVCTDFIDNSAGVNCSDVEVIIKMLLNECQIRKGLSEEERSSLLESMTDDVSRLVLLNNDRQTSALNFTWHYAKKNVKQHADLIEYMEKNRGMDPVAEGLPTVSALKERVGESEGLTMPEICALFSHTKLMLRDQLGVDGLLQDPGLKPYLFDYFPKILQDRYGDLIEQHNLANEIINTVLINNLSADMGVTFVNTMRRELKVTVLEIVRAYVVVVQIFGLRPIIDAVDAMSPSVLPECRHALRAQVAVLIRRSVRWLLHFYRQGYAISELVQMFQPVATELMESVRQMPIDTSALRNDALAEEWMKQGVDPAFARQVAELGCVYHVFNIYEGAKEFNIEVGRFSRAYFFAFIQLDLNLFREKIVAIASSSRWAELVCYSFKQDLDVIQKNMAAKIVAMPITGSVYDKFKVWLNASAPLLEKWEGLSGELKKAESVDSAIMIMGVRILQELVDYTPS